MTVVVQVSKVHPEPGVIVRAAAIIRRGGLVAFPTETVYGLGANALDPDAVESIFTAKERPSYDPLIVHLQDATQMELVAADIPDLTWKLAAEFWPGPLTLVLPRQPRVPSAVTAGGDTVAVRVPSHPVAHALIVAAGVPIAAPSANRFGRVSPTRAEHVWTDLAGRIDIILDAGPTSVGVESTVLSLVEATPRILRPGGVSREALARLLESVEVEHHTIVEGGTAVSPGTTPQHYAPEASLTLFQGPRAQVLPAMRRAALGYIEAGERVGLLLVEEDLSVFADLPVIREALGSVDSLSQIAQRLYSALRALDEAGVEVILARDVGTTGLGLAIRDRLTRAAAGGVVVMSDGSAADSPDSAPSGPLTPLAS